MARKAITDEQVEIELAELRDDEYVKLCREHTRLKYKKRQYLYQLRAMRKKGMELAKAGITMEMIKEMTEECEADD